MVGAAILLGGALGVRHAVEADHLAAVAALVADGDHAPWTGAAWGIGHSVPILVIGAAFIALGRRLPPGIAPAAEAVAAVLLIALGLRVLVGRRPLGVALLRHLHDRDPAGARHHHVAIAGRSIGIAHTHADGESFAVGLVHGLAGSGIVVVALAAAAPTPGAGTGFLAGFALATTLTMGLAAGIGGRAIDRVDRLRGLAGLGSFLFGAALLADAAGFWLPT